MPSEISCTFHFCVPRTDDCSMKKPPRCSEQPRCQRTRSMLNHRVDEEEVEKANSHWRIKSGGLFDTGGVLKATIFCCGLKSEGLKKFFPHSTNTTKTFPRCPLRRRERISLPRPPLSKTGQVFRVSEELRLPATIQGLVLDNKCLLRRETPSLDGSTIFIT